jgi:NTP pyrophosphatase (non-canonical NTP hydrolase)
MLLSEAQQTVDTWIKEVGVRYFNELTNICILNEEVGELTSLFARRYGEQSFKKKISEAEVGEKIEEEMADVLFVLLCLANQTGVNLTDALQKTLEKKTIRDKDRHKENRKLSE